MMGEAPGQGPHMGDLHMNARLNALEAGQVEFRSILRSVDDSLRQLVRLEAHHAETRDGLNRAFRAIKVLDLRADEADKLLANHAHRITGAEHEVAAHTKALATIHQELPKLRQSSGWVNKAVLGSAVLVGTVFGTVVVDRIRAWFAPTPPQQPVAEEQRTTGR